MFQLLHPKVKPDARSVACPARHAVADASSLAGIQLFEALVSETHAAVLRTAGIASSINAMAVGKLLRAPEILKSMLPEQPTLLDALPRCQKELGLQVDLPPVLMKFFISLGYAQTGIVAFCDDAAQWGAEKATFLHRQNLSTVWRRVAHLALHAVAALDPEVRRCLPTRYSENTAVLKKLLSEVLQGRRPCLDVNGVPFLPELPQRRPAARRTVNRPCIVEHQGRSTRALLKDISSSGLGLERVSGMAPNKVAIVEVEGGRCFAGVIVWVRGESAGMKFDTPLHPSDPLLL